MSAEVGNPHGSRVMRAAFRVPSGPPKKDSEWEPKERESERRGRLPVTGSRRVLYPRIVRERAISYLEYQS